MKTLRFILFAALFVGMNQLVVAQKLLPGAYAFSKTKTVHLTAMDGTQLDGMLSEIDMKNGLIKSLEIRDEAGVNHFFRPAQIRNMYIAPEGVDHSGKVYDFIRDPGMWDNETIRQDYIQAGYVYFEQVTVEIGMKSRDMLLQLLNPSFSSKIGVYVDPFVSELTASQGRESFFVRDGNRPAFLLKQGEYMDYFIALFGECEQMVPLKQNAKWNQLDQHIYNYTLCK
jgi:hypothetical protein